MRYIAIHLLLAVATGCPLIANNLVAQENTANLETTSSNSKVVLASEVEWEQLNPARGDKSPQAATLWGDRKGTVATGFLAKFVDGFSSPPHIHNVSYRAVVIAGGIHNDDPDAKPMWMSPGSFWTQPAGEVHITASRGAGIAYVEIESGPYLVLPEDQANDNGERPVNIVPSNMVWLDHTSTSWIAASESANAKTGSDPANEEPTDGTPTDNKQADEAPATNAGPNASLAYLWGDFSNENALTGTMIKLPPGFTGTIECLGSSFQCITIEGQANYHASDEADDKTLTPGSYLVSSGKASHKLSTASGEGSTGCLFYIRSKGRFKIVQ